MNEQSNSADESSSGPLCGERLSEARRKNDISVRDIAKELHLDEPTVRALEKNQFAALGAPVFAKGHLRKYAELVDVSIDDVMADYYQMNRASAAPPVVGPKRKQPTDIPLGPWIGGAVIVLLLVAIVYWWITAGQDWFSRIEPQDTVTIAEPVDDTADLVPDSTAIPVTPTATPSAGEAPPVAAEALPSVTGGAAESTVDPAVATAAVTRQLPEPETGAVAGDSVAAEGEVSMQLSFGTDCWTEISDATGRRLFYDLGAAGRVVTVTGVAPLRVVLGDSTAVSIRVNGEDFPIPDAARSGRLARLTIDP